MNMNLLYVKWIVAGKSIQASMAMIGKIDDASKLLSQNLKENQKHSSYSILFRLLVKICKNDERDVPDQILLRAQNKSYYDLMALGTWLDTNFAIIIQIRRDRRNGGHPALHITQS